MPPPPSALLEPDPLLKLLTPPPPTFLLSSPEPSALASLPRPAGRVAALSPAAGTQRAGLAGGLAGGRGARLPPSYIGRHRSSGPQPLRPPACRARHPAAPAMGRQKELVSRCGEMLHIRYRLLRQALAECLGTLILVVSGRTQRAHFSPGPTLPIPSVHLRDCFSRQRPVLPHLPP